MDLGRLGKKARNELLRNPKKSAILAVICLVALYFWLPLLRGWLPGGKKPAKGAPKTVASAAKTPAPADEPPAENAKSIARAEAAFRWDKLERLRKQDPRTLSASLAPLERSPFQLSAELSRALAAQEEETKPTIQPPPMNLPVVEITPASLGLVLKGTLVGKRSRAATINGKAYSEGANVKVRMDAPHGMSTSESGREFVEFTLSKVNKDFVTLTRDAKTYTLEFLKESLPEGNEIVLGGQAEGSE